MTRDPVKARTRLATRHLIARAELTPTPCARCGAADVEAHHTSYDDPRAVEFLCRPCHVRAHGCMTTADLARSIPPGDVRRVVIDAMGEMTQVEFAALLGVHQSKLSRFLSGEHGLIHSLARAMYRAFPQQREAIVAAHWASVRPRGKKGNHETVEAAAS